MKRGMPRVQVKPDAAALAMGMDLSIAPMFAKPGTPRLAYNYERAANGGMERLRGIEPFDGRPSPSAATYVMLQCTVTIAGIALGDTVTGATSGATGRAIYLAADMIAMTRVTGTFVVEALQVGGITKATVLSTTPTIDGFTDNIVSKLAADNYQADITKVPGESRIRGFAALNSVLYAWRNNVGSTAMAIYKSTSGGWVLVPMYHQISFSAGSSAYAEGSTLTQGFVTATVKRVVVETGTWGGAPAAAGRLIITTPSGGSFAAGAAAGGGACTLSGASALIVLAPSGSVRTNVYSFTASLATTRLYGCDGVNPEFEFDGDILVPLNTGMGSIRAETVCCHKNHLFYGYRGSLQNSAISNPYVWSAIFGAAELATGDIITNLVSIGGATDAASMVVLCQNAIAVLYGTSAANFQLVPHSRISGAQARSAQDIGGIVALDTPGVVHYPPTRAFGNFAWDTVSMQIQDIARSQTCACSVFVTGLFKYRIFFADGTAISGLPIPRQGGVGFEWTVINYGRTILFAEHAEINGVARTFYADDQGWVYEADVGRSLAGDAMPYAIKLHPMSQRSPGVDKQYWQMQIELKASSACTIYTSGEFGGNEQDGSTEEIATPQYGSGLTYDLSNFDQSYWDVAAVSRKTMPMEGEGTSVAPTIAGSADNELTHTIYAITLLYTMRKLTR